MPGPPVISYASFTTSDPQNGVIAINFTDPDGDIGLNQSDTGGAYAYDFYMRYYVWSPYANTYVKYYRAYTNGNSLIDSSIIAYRIPFVVNNSKSKSLDGQVIVNLNGYRPPRQDAYDDTLQTFRFQIWIYDRALHKSNVITTPSFTTNYAY